MRLIMRLSAIGLFGYVAFVAVLFANQRPMLFATDDGGALAAANWIAIKDSQRLNLKTSDGETLAAWYLPPAANKPVFLFLHGKGGGLQRKKWRWQRIRKAGFGVLAFSYRGYPGSTGYPSEDGVIRDARTAFDWLAKRHAANRIVIHGLSLGTGVGVALAQQVNARALILEAPYTATVDVAAERYPFVPVRLFMRDQFLSRERIARINMPVLIVHGTKDTVIPFHHGVQLFARASQPKTFIKMPGSDHSTLVRDGLYPHIWRFLGFTDQSAASGLMQFPQR